MARIPTRGLKPGQLFEIIALVFFFGWLFLKYIVLWDKLFGNMEIDIEYLIIPSFILIIVVLRYLVKSWVDKAKR